MGRDKDYLFMVGGGEKTSASEIIKHNSIPTEVLLSAENLKNVIQTMFANCTILNTEVKRGAKSSANIYVNKKYVNKKVTVIIWN